MRRRDALIIGGAMAIAVAIPPVLRRKRDHFTFQQLPGFEEFRRLDRGAISATQNPFSGLDGPAPRPPNLPPCQALFGPEGWTGDLLPVAVFTDVNCPNCATFEARLLRLRENGTPIRLIWHQLPLLGPRSVAAARATLAADLQDAGDAVYRDLMQRVLRPGPAAIQDLAARHGLDADRMLADIEGNAVQARLDASLGLGAALGIPGTPGTMVGRTLVIGAMVTAELQALIDLELSEPFRGC
jgi:predicted DsbA family dithiol-disulfide isomerase